MYTTDIAHIHATSASYIERVDPVHRRILSSFSELYSVYSEFIYLEGLYRSMNSKHTDSHTKCAYKILNEPHMWHRCLRSRYVCVWQLPKSQNARNTLDWCESWASLRMYVHCTDKHVHCTERARDGALVAAAAISVIFRNIIPTMVSVFVFDALQRRFCFVARCLLFCALHICRISITFALATPEEEKKRNIVRRTAYNEKISNEKMKLLILVVAQRQCIDFHFSLSFFISQRHSPESQ